MYVSLPSNVNQYLEIRTTRMSMAIHISVLCLSVCVFFFVSCSARDIADRRRSQQGAAQKD